jgi:hypothetical protein
MEYYFYPPFFVVSEENSFSDAWESFCCKLLNLAEKTDEIYRRKPPEQGIDLYYPNKKISYQCKSVESGKSGDFDASKTIESIRSARKIQSELGWEKYVLCTNVDLTGNAESKLRTELPNIILRTKTYWQSLCEANNEIVKRNFNVLLKIPQRKLEETISESFYEHYSEQMFEMLKNDSYEIFFYSNRYDRIYELKVSSSFKIDDLLHIIRNFFNIPPFESSSEEISINTVYSIVFNEKTQPFNLTLKDAGIISGSIITFWKKYFWKDLKKIGQVDTKMYHMTMKMMEIKFLSPEERYKIAAQKRNQEIIKAFEKFNSELEGSLEK